MRSYGARCALTRACKYPPELRHSFVRAAIAPLRSDGATRHQCGDPPTRMKRGTPRTSPSAAPCLADAAIQDISQTCAPIAHRPARCAGYSVCNEFAHGPYPELCGAQHRRVPDFMAEFGTAFLCSMHAGNLDCKPFATLFYANLDRERQIWPEDWCGRYSLVFLR